MQNIIRILSYLTQKGFLLRTRDPGIPMHTCHLVRANTFQVLCPNLVVDNPTIICMGWGLGLGPRNCVAMRFGLAEGKAALAHLVLNFRLEPVATTPIPMRFSKTEAMKPEEGALYLSLKAR